MNFVRIIVAAIAASGASIGTALAQGPDAGPAAPEQAKAGEFVLTMCNRSKDPIVFVAVGSRVVGPTDRTKIQGWWAIPQGQCHRIGAVPQPGFVFYAKSKVGTEWIGTRTVNACIDDQSRFAVIVNSGGETVQCPASQRVVKFTLVEVPAEKKTFTMNLN